MSEKKLGMLIDLSLCVGCNACAVACKQENEVPTGCFNTWIESFDVETDGQIKRANIPKLCNHCEDAPCVKVCPTQASHRTEDGMIVVDPERCIGCKYCMAATRCATSCLRARWRSAPSVSTAPARECSPPAWERASRTLACSAT